MTLNQNNYEQISDILCNEEELKNLKKNKILTPEISQDEKKWEK